MQKTYSAYIVDTGEITGKRILCGPELLALNTAPGEAWLLGEVDHRGQRVELRPDDFGNAVVPVVVAWQPDKPAVSEYADWAWDETRREWLYVATLAALKVQRSAPVIEQLAAIDVKLIRPAGEITQAMALGEAVPAAAALRLTTLNADKAALRQFLAQISSATTAAALDALVAAGPNAGGG